MTLRHSRCLLLAAVPCLIVTLAAAPAAAQNEIQIAKDPATQTVNTGDTASFTITVTSFSNGTLSDVVVSDPLTPSCARTRVSLAPGESFGYVCTTGQLYADLDNVATVTATRPDSAVVSDSDTAQVTVSPPRIEITKSPDWQQVNPGESATFTITITALADDFNNVYVTDALTPDCDSYIEYLPYGEPFEYTCTTSALYSDLLNVATVTAQGVQTGFASDTDTAFVDVVTPIEIVKSPDLQYVVEGGTASFTIAIRNFSGSPLSNLVVADPLTPDCARAAGTLPDLPVDGSTSYTCETSALTSGFENEATVTATLPDSSIVSHADTAVVEVMPAMITIAKTPDTQQVNAGDTATFTITITCLAEPGCAQLAVQDPLTPDCERGPGEPPAIPPDLEDLPYLGEVSYTCTTAPLYGDLLNVATVTTLVGNEEPAAAADSALVQVLSAGAEISKTPDFQTVTPGAAASFTITVTNSGTGTMSNIVVSDPATPGCARTLADLAPGGSYSYTCQTGPLTADFENVALLTADTAAGPVAISDAALVALTSSAISISKLPAVQTVDPGQTATFTITIGNLSAGVLSNVAVADPMTPSCARTLSDLPVAGSTSYTCSTGPITADLTNVATATATIAGLPVTATASALVDVQTPIEISKQPAWQAVFSGTPATFTITLSNNHAGLLSALSVSDPQTPDCSRAVGQLADLPTGGSLSYTCQTGPLTADLTNVATVTASSSEGPVSAMATAVVEVAAPQLELTKTPDSLAIDSGGTVSFTITVRNPNEFEVTNITVSDPLTPACSTTIASLASGAMQTFSCTTDALTTTLTNTVTANGSSAYGAAQGSATATVQVQAQQQAIPVLGRSAVLLLVSLLAAIGGLLLRRRSM